MAPYKNPEHGTYAAHYIFLDGQLYSTSPQENVREVTHVMLAERDNVLEKFRQATQRDSDSVYAASFMVVGDRITVYKSLRKYRTLEFPATKRAFTNAVNAFRTLSPGFTVEAG